MILKINADQLRKCNIKNIYNDSFEEDVGKAEVIEIYNQRCKYVVDSISYNHFVSIYVYKSSIYKKEVLF